jgi:hypothetical protein
MSEQTTIPPHSAFIRQCNGCNQVTAIDLDPTPERYRELCLYGETVRLVSKASAMEQWNNARRCKCGKEKA